MIFARALAVSPLFMAMLFAPGTAMAQLGAQAIMDYFGATCPSQGKWMQSAMSAADALKGALKEVENDPSCAGFRPITEGEGGSLVADNLRTLQNDQTLRDLTSLKTEQKEVLFQLSEPDLTIEEKIALRTQLRGTQISIATLETDKSFAAKDGALQRQGLAAKRLVDSIEALNRQAIAQQDCMQKHPKLLQNIATLTGSVGAALATSGISLGVSAATEIVAGIVERARQNKIAKRVADLTSLSSQTAYACALESISNQWCNANDALRIVNLNQKILEDERPATELGGGILLVQRDLPKVLEWLARVRDGAQPTNLTAANRLTLILDRFNKVQKIDVQSSAAIAEMEPLFNDEPTFKGKYKRLQLLILGLREFFFEGPFAPGELISTEAAFPYELLGVMNPPKDSDGNPMQFENYDPFEGNAGFEPDLEVVKSELSKALGRARDQVSLELNRARPDVLAVLTDATDEDYVGRSPLHSLIRVRNYFQKYLPQPVPPPLPGQRRSVSGSNAELSRRLVLDTIDRLNNIIAQIEKVRDEPTPGPGEPRLPIPVDEFAEIFKEASLDNGTGLLKDRIEKSVRIVTIHIIKSGSSGLDQDLESMLLASTDVMNEIKAFSQRDDLSQIRADIEKAQGVNEVTLNSFAKAFERGLSKTLEKLGKETAASPPKSVSQNDVLPSSFFERPGVVSLDRATTLLSEGASRRYAEICLLLLSVPEYPSKLDISVCNGVRLHNGWVNGPKSPEFEKLVGTPFKERVCTFRDFRRASSIYQRRMEEKHARVNE